MGVKTAGDEAVGRVGRFGLRHGIGHLRALGQRGLEFRGPAVLELAGQQAAAVQAIHVFLDGVSKQFHQFFQRARPVAKHHHLPLAQVQGVALQ